MTDALFYGLEGGGGVAGRNGAYRGKHCVVNGPGVVQKYANNFLNPFGLFRRERRGGGRDGELCFFSVLWRSPRIGGVLWITWWRVAKTFERLRNGLRHVEVDRSLAVVPLETDTAKNISVPVHYYLVHFF